MGKQISIIIPTYNMEKYIGKCLDSLLIPEFEQVEVLVVNDGSNDRSSEIAHSYADRYPNSIRIVDKPNGNYGSCINAALPLITGRYVKVLDADDTFDADAFSKFVSLLPNCNEDVVLTSFRTVNAESEIISEKSVGFYNKPCNEHIDLAKIYEMFDSYVAMHQITYKTSLFNNINYKQVEGVSYSDGQWSIVPLAYAKTARLIDLYLYRYLLGREGQTTDPKQVIKSLSNYFIVLREIIRYYVDANNETAKRFMEQQIRLITRREYQIAINAGDASSLLLLKENDTYIKEHAPDLYEALNDVNYDDLDVLGFKFIKHLRKSDYKWPVRYNLLRRAILGISINLGRLIKA